MTEELGQLKIDKGRWPQAARKRRVSRPLLILGLLVLAGLAAFLFIPRATEVQTVSVVAAYPSQTFTVLNASGYVTAQRKAALASKSSARLVWIGVEEGSRVTEGQVVARLEQEDVNAALERSQAGATEAVSAIGQAKAELDDATRNYKRMVPLLKEKIIAQSDYDSALARLEKAQSAWETARWNAAQAKAQSKEAAVNVEYTLIRAPFAGVVLTKNADIGDMITPLGAASGAKASVVTIADMTSLLVEADVSESNLAKVRMGQPCEISLDAIPAERFPGSVHMIVPTADRTKASVMVKVRFAQLDPRVLPEMSAKVGFLERAAAPEERTPRPCVNPAAVVSRDGHDVVFAVQNGTAAPREVRTGPRLGEYVEIQDGAKAGDILILNPPEALKAGAKVKVKP